MNTNDGSFWARLSDEMSDKAKHTANKEWSEPMIQVARGAFSLASLHREADGKAIGADMDENEGGGYGPATTD